MFSERLKEARKKAGLTQKTVREAVGVSQAMYGFMETGDKMPSVAVIKKLVRLFHVSADYLLETEDYAEEISEEEE